MKNTKSLILTFISLLLIFFSVGILWKSGFFYPRKKYNTITNDNSVIDSLMHNTANNDEDSIQNKLQIANNDSSLFVYDSSEISRNSKISSIAESNVLKPEDAQQKINLLEQELERLKNENSNYEKLNKDLLEKLTDKNSSSYISKYKNSNKYKEDSFSESDSKKNEENIDQYTSASTYILSKLQLQAFEIRDESETETDSASKVSKISALFTFGNTDNKTYNGDIMLVITQPNGKAFKGSPWQVGVFETTEGRRIYSCKFKMDCSAGENKDVKIDFYKDELMKGTYTLQVFKNGFQIGKTNLMLQ